MCDFLKGFFRKIDQKMVNNILELFPCEKYRKKTGKDLANERNALKKIQDKENDKDKENIEIEKKR